MRTDGMMNDVSRCVCAFHTLSFHVAVCRVLGEYSGIFLSMRFGRVQESKVKVIVAGWGKLSANMLQHSKWRNLLKLNLFLFLLLVSQPVAYGTCGVFNVWHCSHPLKMYWELLNCYEMFVRRLFSFLARMIQSLGQRSLGWIWTYFFDEKRKKCSSECAYGDWKMSRQINE